MTGFGRILEDLNLVALKRIAGRDQDLLDLRQLETAHGHLPDSRGE